MSCDFPARKQWVSWSAKRGILYTTHSVREEVCHHLVSTMHLIGVLKESISARRSLDLGIRIASPLAGKGVDKVANKRKNNAMIVEEVIGTVTPI